MEIAYPMPSTSVAAAFAGVDTNNLAAHVKQRSAGIAGIYGGVGLNHGNVAVVQLSVKTADNARRYRLTVSEGVSIATTCSPTLRDDESPIVATLI